MFKFRVTNLGAAGERGNRSLLEFSKENTKLCNAVWDMYRAVSSGSTTADAKFVHSVFQSMLQNSIVNGGDNAFQLSNGDAQIKLEYNSKGIVSPTRLPYPVTFCEKVDEENIVAEFTSVKVHSSTVDSLVAWMLAQHEYKADDLQLLKMHCIINCTMILEADEAVRLLAMGDSSNDPVKYLYDFEDEDAIFVQEWDSDLEPLTNGGATENFTKNATVVSNIVDETNVAACITTGTFIDITDETVSAMRSHLTTWLLQCKPNRFTATYHPGSRQSGRPSVVVVNWHAKFVKDSEYEEMFVDVCAYFFDAVETAMEKRNIIDDVCTLVVADSNLQSETSGKKTAQLCAKRNMELFNHTEKSDLKSKGKPRENTWRNILVNNVNRDRRYSNMSAQWQKANEDAPETHAPKGVVVSLANSPFIVHARCKERATPSVDYKLDHGHFIVTVEHKNTSMRAALFFLLLLFLGILLGASMDLK